VKEFDPNNNGNRKRAWRIRQKAEAERSADELAWLAAYESHLAQKQAAPPEDGAGSGGDPTPAPGAEPQPPAAGTEGAPTPPADVPPSSPPEGLPKVPKPPRVMSPPAPPPAPPPKVRREEDGKPSSTVKGDWRKKYVPKFAIQGADGQTVELVAEDARELACVQIGGLLATGCEVLAALLRRVGSTPIVDPAMARGSFVLLVDQLLPREAELKPEHVAIGVTGILAGQCLFNFKAIKKELASSKERTEHESKLAAMKKKTEEDEKRYREAEAAKWKEADELLDKARKAKAASSPPEPPVPTTVDLLRESAPPPPATSIPRDVQPGDLY
jgi:hypothetical protein